MLFAFDCDGVLVDSEFIASQVDSELLKEVGYDISAEEVSQRFAGLTSAVIHAMIEKEIGRKLPADYLERQRAELDRRLATELKPVAGAAEILDTIEGPRCVCSNSSSHRLKITLETTGLMDRVRPYVYSAVEVGTKEPKPAPNVYLHAIKEFGADPREVLVIEDSAFGVRAAKAAGARVVGFTGGRHSWVGHADLLTEAGAETVFRRFSDLPRIAEAVMGWEGLDE